MQQDMECGSGANMHDFEQKGSPWSRRPGCLLSQTTIMSDPPTLGRLHETLTESSPYCSGRLQLPDDSFELFYGKETPKYVSERQTSSSRPLTRTNVLRFINISKTENCPGSLDALQSAC